MDVFSFSYYHFKYKVQKKSCEAFEQFMNGK